jgi:hypothetical protein
MRSITDCPELLKELKEERRKIDRRKYITLRDYKAKYSLH